MQIWLSLDKFSIKYADIFWKWITSKNKIRLCHDNFVSILQEMAQTNGKMVSEKDAQAIRTALQTISQEAKAAKEVQLTVYDMFGSHFYKKTLILMGCWVSGILSYYALTLNVGDLAGDIFVNYVVTSLADIPAHLSVFFLVDSLGWSLIKYWSS